MKTRPLEWPTLAMMALCYAMWVFGTTVLADMSLLLGTLVVGVAVALHSSLTHEVIHGHPFRWAKANEALVYPNLGLLIPFIRFRDTHLAHHLNADLTDPYDDPESNYLDPAVWRGLPRVVQIVLLANNTLLGRILLGTMISQIAFMVSDIRRWDRTIALGWLWHIPAVALVLWWVIAVSAMPIWAYLIAAYIGLSLIKIRTFAEHQARERAAGRTAIIEDRGILAYLFLNNNLHDVHHKHPRVPWYHLPALYRANKERFLARNGAYVFKSYAQVFRRYFFRRQRSGAASVLALG